MSGRIQKVGDGGVAERVFNRLGGVIQLAMQWAKMDAVQAQGAFMKPAYRIDGIDHFQHGQFGGTACQGESPIQSSLGIDEFGPSEVLHDLGEIA